MMAFKDLFLAVFLMFLYIIPGFLLNKLKIVDATCAKGLSKIVMYVAQTAMLVVGFIKPFDIAILKTAGMVFLLSIVVNFMFYGIVKLCFRKAPDKTRRVLQYGMMFSNAGYMGIPVILAVLGSECIIYATVYLVSFNMFSFSLGRLIYTDDKKFVSLKGIIINPATIPLVLGMLCFLLPAEKVIPESVLGFLNGESAAVAPLSMMVVGLRIADLRLTPQGSEPTFRNRLKGLFIDKYMYGFLAMRLLVMPFLVWILMKICVLIGVYINAQVMSVVLICCSTPAATATVMFSEIYDANTPYASKLTAVSTLLSIITMPLIALLP